MGSAHDLLARTDWRGADLASLAREQLKPYISGGSPRVQIEGPPVLAPAQSRIPVWLRHL